jgi:hypothetical protein
MSTIRASPLLGRLVDLDVLDNEIIGVQALAISIGLSILQQALQELSGLDGPAGLAHTELLAYSPISMCILPIYASSHVDNNATSKSMVLASLACYVPCAVRPVLPAYRLIGTASLWCWTLSRYARARWSFQPLIAWAVSRVFLKEQRR